MNNFSLLQKQQLETICEAGGQVYTVAYNPTTPGAPPAPPTGLVEFYRETTSTLVEIIYTTP
jgi:endo-alpha-1,4-polygalactosaminidase (GH114 family)